MMFVGALLCGASATAFAQETDPMGDDAARAQAEVILRDRNRSTMHPGNALEVVGIEQGDNDARARTPALANSNRAATNLNPDDNYERTLAMYDSAAHFSKPAKAVLKTREATSRSAWKRVIDPLDDAGHSKGPARWFILSGLVSMLAGIVVLVWRRLSAELADGRQPT
jgi:hypothetical protein